MYFSYLSAVNACIQTLSPWLCWMNRVPLWIKWLFLHGILCFVSVPPSPPVCQINGKAEYWNDISLTCLSEEGSPQPVYEWKSFSVEDVPRQFPPKTTESMFRWGRHLWQPAREFIFHSSVSEWTNDSSSHYVAEEGVLSLFNISRGMSGFYTCTSTNRVGSARCNFTLAVTPGECEDVIYRLISSQWTLKEVPFNSAPLSLLASLFNLPVPCPLTLFPAAAFFTKALINSCTLDPASNKYQKNKLAAGYWTSQCIRPVKYQTFPSRK